MEITNRTFLSFQETMADVEFNFELLIGQWSPSPAPRPPRRAQLRIRPVNLDLDSDEEDDGPRRLIFDHYVDEVDSQGWEADSETTELIVDLADTSDEEFDPDETDVEDWEEPGWIPTDEEWVLKTPRRN